MLLHLEEDLNDPPAKCFEPNDAGQLPTCSSTGDGGWDVSYPSSDDGFEGAGFGGGFVFLFVLVALAGVVGAAWKVNAARTMARRSGMDPNEATAMTLLTDDGLEATYLAANLRGESPAPPHAAAPTAPPALPADRLQALQDLKDRGLITETEYADRRQAIIDAI